MHTPLLSRRRLSAAAVVALSLIVALMVTAVLVLDYRETRRVERQSLACDSARSYLSEYGLTTRSPQGKASVAVLGDSYTSGDGLDDRTDAWSYQVARTVAGLGSTGFTNGGYCGGHAYRDRLPAVLDKDPETLVIQGGLNDTTADPAGVRDAARALLEEARGVPRVIVVGPVDAPARGGEQSVDAALSAAAQDVGAEYVTALDWELEFLPDDLHLTVDGHAEFADLVQQHLD